jgi:hypothetical protein
MFTNELKKGDQVILSNGWTAEIFDNARGNTRIAKVYGFETEIGSVYSHDIAWCVKDGQTIKVEHTPAQIKLRKQVRAMGM